MKADIHHLVKTRDLNKSVIDVEKNPTIRSTFYQLPLFTITGYYFKMNPQYMHDKIGPEIVV